MIKEIRQCTECGSKDLRHTEAHKLGYEKEKHQGKIALYCGQCRTTLRLS